MRERCMSQLKALPLLILFVKLRFMKDKKEIFTEERRTGDLQNISGILLPLAKKMIGKKAFAEADIIANWSGIAGEEIASYSNPLKIDFKKGERTEGTLYVETFGGAFAVELQLKSKILIEKVNVFFGYKAVQHIKIVQNSKLIKNDVQDVVKSQKKLVTADEENYIEQISGGLASKGLTETLQNLGRAVFNDNKKRDKNDGNRNKKS